MSPSLTAQAAYDIWSAYRHALETKAFKNELLISICEEEEREWQNIYLTLTENESKGILMELGFAGDHEETKND
jgi:hypothetical protein